MEHEDKEQDSPIEEQRLAESSLNLEGAHSPSPRLTGGLSPQELVDTDPLRLPEQWWLSLHHSSWQVRARAVQGLRGSTDPAVIKQLITCLSDEAAVVRITTLQVLGPLGKRVAVEYLLPTLTDPDWTVRETAVLTLGKRVPHKLLPAFYDEEKFVREAAIYVLKGRLPLKKIIDDLKHGDMNLRVSAARVLGELEEAEEPVVLSALIEALQHDEQSIVRKEAILALGQMEIRTTGALQAALRSALHDSDQDVCVAAELVLDAKGIALVPASDAGLVRVDVNTPATLWPSMQETETTNDVQVGEDGDRAHARRHRKTTNYVGQRFGSYLLTDIIGEGSLATVYAGKHIYLKTQVAIKVLHVHLPEKDLADFLNEAQTVAKLKHPAIVRILDFGVENSIPFLVMDYAPQGNLRQRYPRGVPLPLSIIVLYIKQIAAALQYAHDNGVIHKDVKPENILLGSDNTILLSDFGIAQLERDPANPYQNRDKVSGTLPYMAPEQWRGEPCAASDQYALAIVVYEWLCGVLPFRGSTLYGIMNNHLSDAPPPLRQYVPNLSYQVEEVVLTALAKKPQQRFSNVQAFADALIKTTSPVPPSFFQQMIKQWLHFIRRIQRP